MSSTYLIGFAKNILNQLFRFAKIHENVSKDRRQDLIMKFTIKKKMIL